MPNWPLKRRKRREEGTSIEIMHKYKNFTYMYNTYNTYVVFHLYIFLIPVWYLINILIVCIKVSSVKYHVSCIIQRQQQLATSACASNTFPIFERFYPILALLLPGNGKLGPRAGLID